MLFIPLKVVLKLSGFGGVEYPFMVYEVFESLIDHFCSCDHLHQPICLDPHTLGSNTLSHLVEHLCW